MYDVVWTSTASKEYFSTLEYWIEHNKSPLYSAKIQREVSKTEQGLKLNPLFLSTYIERIGLYKRIFFKGKFVLFYEIQDNIIFIEHFRSTRQKPL